MCNNKNFSKNMLPFCLSDEESNPESISGIFEGVPDCRDLGEPEFEACDKPFLPTYNLPVEKDGVVIG